MNEIYDDFIKKVKEKSKSNKDVVIKYNDSENIDYKNNDSILEIKEYKKDFLTIGVVLLQKEVIKPIDYSNVDNIDIKSDTMFYSKIILIDSENEIDNIMVNKSNSLDDAKKHFNELNDIVKNNSLLELIKILKESIS